MAATTKFQLGDIYVTELQREIFELLEKNPSFKIKDISQRLNRSESGIDRPLQDFYRTQLGEDEPHNIRYALMKFVSAKQAAASSTPPRTEPILPAAKVAPGDIVLCKIVRQREPDKIGVEIERVWDSSLGRDLPLMRPVILMTDSGQERGGGAYAYCSVDVAKVAPAYATGRPLRPGNSIWQSIAGFATQRFIEGVGERLVFCRVDSTRLRIDLTCAEYDDYVSSTLRWAEYLIVVWRDFLSESTDDVLRLRPPELFEFAVQQGRIIATYPKDPRGWWYPKVEWRKQLAILAGVRNDIDRQRHGKDAVYYAWDDPAYDSALRSHNP